MAMNRHMVMILTVLCLFCLNSDAGSSEVGNHDPVEKVSKRSLHPNIRLLDAKGNSVVQTSRPLSLFKTCGACHDTDYITRNNYHMQVGMDEQFAPDRRAGVRSWDTSPGLFGRWDPLTYRFLTPCDWEELDMGTAEWIKTVGSRHAGGGPAERSTCSSEILTDLKTSDKVHRDTHVFDLETGSAKPWNWQKSGTVELNCLLCHTPSPNNVKRIEAIKKGAFKWASTATLLGSGLVKETERAYTWLPEHFDSQGKISPEHMPLIDPGDANCRLCHGQACRCQDPHIFDNSRDNWVVETTGEVYSSKKLSDSEINLEQKETLTRPWDVHAAHGLKCVNCHYSPNNPQYNEKEKAGKRPDHLTYDARKMDIGQYLQTPNHNIVKGHTAQGTVARIHDNSMRNCQDCHNAESSHDFLPFKKLHFQKLNCNACHIKKVHSPVRMVTDWTLPDINGNPRIEHRGVIGPINEPASVITGWEPCLLAYEEQPGVYKLGPYTIMTSWFWVGHDPERPVSQFDLNRAFITPEGKYCRFIETELDINKDGLLDENELVLDNQLKVEAVKDRLKYLGVTNPGILGEIQPYSLSHGLASKEFAMRQCLECHSQNSRFRKEIRLASRVPGYVLPRKVPDAPVVMHGDLVVNKSGNLMCIPTIGREMFYIHGTLDLQWFDVMGIVLACGSLGGIVLHGVIRLMPVRRRKTRNVP